MSWRDSTAQLLGPACIRDVNDYVTHATPSAISAIDAFYLASQDILKAGTPTLLTSHPTIGTLLLVGLVSVTENYFRDLFSCIVKTCPIAKAAAADQSVKLGSVIWHGTGGAIRAAFEHISFASAENLISTCKKYIGYSLRRTSVIDEFERVCELRHAIAHSSSYIAGKNAVRLHVTPHSTRLRVKVGFAELQECAAICTSLVVSLNRELFIELARRWAKEWPLKPSWDPSQRHSCFMSIWHGFHSTIDDDNGLIADRMSAIKCRNRVAADPF
jgi:hypothetical protein